MSALLLAPAMVSWATPIVYSTGFESPTYSTGLLNGQDGWTVISSPSKVTVQNSVVYSGSQAVMLDGSGASAFTQAYRSTSYNTSVYDPDILSLTAYTLLGSGTLDSQFRLVGYYSSGNAIAELIITPDGSLKIFGNGSLSAVGVSISSSQWHQIGLVFDFTTQEAQAIFNGVSIGPKVGFNTTGATSTFGLSVMEVGSVPGSNRLYVDNLNLEAIPSSIVTPEPGTIGLGAAGLALLAYFKRKGSR